MDDALDTRAALPAARARRDPEPTSLDQVVPVGEAAGVGENAASLGASVGGGLEFLGVRLDLERNMTCQPDSDIAQRHSPSRILVIRTREDLMIAREAAAGLRVDP